MSEKWYHDTSGGLCNVTAHDDRVTVSILSPDGKTTTLHLSADTAKKLTKALRKAVGR